MSDLLTTVDVASPSGTWSEHDLDISNYLGTPPSGSSRNSYYPPSCLISPLKSNAVCFSMSDLNEDERSLFFSQNGFTGNSCTQQVTEKMSSGDKHQQLTKQDKIAQFTKKMKLTRNPKLSWADATAAGLLQESQQKFSETHQIASLVQSMEEEKANNNGGEQQADDNGLQQQHPSLEELTKPAPAATPSDEEENLYLMMRAFLEDNPNVLLEIKDPLIRSQMIDAGDNLPRLSKLDDYLERISGGVDAHQVPRLHAKPTLGPENDLSELKELLNSLRASFRTKLDVCACPPAPKLPGKKSAAARAAVGASDSLRSAPCTRCLRDQARRDDDSLSTIDKLQPSDRLFWLGRREDPDSLIQMKHSAILAFKSYFRKDLRKMKSKIELMYVAAHADPQACVELLQAQQLPTPAAGYHLKRPAPGFGKLDAALKTCAEPRCGMRTLPYMRYCKAHTSSQDGQCLYGDDDQASSAPQVVQNKRKAIKRKAPGAAVKPAVVSVKPAVTETVEPVKEPLAPQKSYEFDDFDEYKQTRKKISFDRSCIASDDDNDDVNNQPHHDESDMMSMLMLPKSDPKICSEVPARNKSGIAYPISELLSNDVMLSCVGLDDALNDEMKKREDRAAIEYNQFSMFAAKCDYAQGEYCDGTSGFYDNWGLEKSSILSAIKEVDDKPPQPTKIQQKLYPPAPKKSRIVAHQPPPKSVQQTPPRTTSKTDAVAVDNSTVTAAAGKKPTATTGGRGRGGRRGRGRARSTNAAPPGSQAKPAAAKTSTRGRRGRGASKTGQRANARASSNLAPFNTASIMIGAKPLNVVNHHQPKTTTTTIINGPPVPVLNSGLITINGTIYNHVIPQHSTTTQSAQKILCKDNGTESFIVLPVGAQQQRTNNNANHQQQQNINFASSTNGGQQQQRIVNQQLLKPIVQQSGRPQQQKVFVINPPKNLNRLLQQQQQQQQKILTPATAPASMPVADQMRCIKMPFVIGNPTSKNGASNRQPVQLLRAAPIQNNQKFTPTAVKVLTGSIQQRVQQQQRKQQIYQHLPQAIRVGQVGSLPSGGRIISPTFEQQQQINAQQVKSYRVLTKSGGQMVKINTAPKLIPIEQQQQQTTQLVVVSPGANGEEHKISIPAHHIHPQQQNIRVSQVRGSIVMAPSAAESVRPVPPPPQQQRSYRPTPLIIQKSKQQKALQHNGGPGGGC